MRVLLTVLFLTTAMSFGAEAAPPLPAQIPVPRSAPAANDIPVPAARPRALPASEAAQIDPQVTAGIATPDNPAQPAASGDLKSGLDALYAKNVALARATRDAMPPSLDKDILTWAIALSGYDGVPSADIAAAANALPGWPGLSTLRANSERALLRENPPANLVIAAFGATPPQTPEGAVILARARLATGDRAGAIAALGPIWRDDALDAGAEQMILSEFASVIPQSDHLARMIRMLYEQRVDQAKRVARLAGAEPLYAAWAAVIRETSDAAAKIAAVGPGWRNSPAFLFLRAQYARRSEHYEDAFQLLMKAPREASALVEPDQWWIERRIVSRGLLDKGDAKDAYRLAATHCCESPVMAAEAEFHAGWYALRGLMDPALAEPHFAKIAQLSSKPLSVSRAYYWLGRASEAGGPGEARAFYEKAARYGTTFYGQLAAAKLGDRTLHLTDPETTAADRTRFAGREPVRAIGRLEDIGYGWRANVLYVDLAQELKSPGELTLLARLAQKNENQFMALKVGKIAVSRGFDLAALSHPLGVIPDVAGISGSGKALAYAVARQESEFNIAAVSRAGARGLLQLMPSTAKAVARKAGLPYSKARLTTDAAYNARLGSHFLAEQIDRFDGSYILTFAGYNAGPTRAQQWIDRYGDPRGKPVDEVVDWIERIPFTETRNYVQRVMENFEVYKARITGQADIAVDLVKGSRQQAAGSRQ